MIEKYILVDRKPVRCDDVFEWAKWFESSIDNRRVALTKIGDVEVSTVFLGINHNWGKGEPLLFETMVFNGMWGGEMMRCSTWELAEMQHAEMVGRVRAGQPK